MSHTVVAPTNDVLGDLDAVAIAEHIANGKFTASEAVQAALARLQAVNPQLNAIASERYEQAKMDAARLDKSSARSPLAGVPSFIKDNTDLAGLPTRYGSRGMPKTPLTKTGEFAEQFLSTGLIPLAKTTLPEFGLTATTEFSQSKPTRNPWHTDHSTGGSSGGSAALVAAGVVPIAHANDGGGSIRIPAACCGLVGLKPTRGRFRKTAMAARLPLNILADGVVTRTVRDTATFFAAAEQHYQNVDLPPIGQVTAPGKQRLRIALFTDFQDGQQSAPEVVAAVEKVAQTCQELGHTVVPIASPVEPQMADDFFLYWAMLAASANYLGRFELPGFDRKQLEPLTYGLSQHFLKNAWRFPGALKRLKNYEQVHREKYADFDLALTPTLATPPPKIGHLSQSLDFATLTDRLHQYAVFTPVQNVTGAPAISLPLGQTAGGLPIGVQFGAKPGQEKLLLEVAYEMEMALPWGYLSS